MFLIVFVAVSLVSFLLSVSYDCRHPLKLLVHVWSQTEPGMGKVMLIGVGLIYSIYDMIG